MIKDDADKNYDYKPGFPANVKCTVDIINHGFHMVCLWLSVLLIF